MKRCNHGEEVGIETNSIIRLATAQSGLCVCSCSLPKATLFLHAARGAPRSVGNLRFGGFRVRVWRLGRLDVDLLALGILVHVLLAGVLEKSTGFPGTWKKPHLNQWLAHPFSIKPTDQKDTYGLLAVGEAEDACGAESAKELAGQQRQPVEQWAHASLARVHHVASVQ